MLFQKIVKSKQLRQHHIHFVGIGGIGVSALARFYLARKDRVSGSDITRSEITDSLQKEGARVFIGSHNAKNLPVKTGVVVFTAATPKDNPELKEARRKKIKIKSYAEALGELTEEYFTIAVAGTHGKSTTTAMVSLMMTHAGLDPTVIIGTKLKEFGNTNFREGKSKYFVVEADEYAGSFWNYHPDIVVVTNIDADHLDFYKTVGAIQNSFGKFLRNIKITKKTAGGVALNHDDTRTRSLVRTPFLKKHKNMIRWFSHKDPEMSDIQKHLRVFGEHNRMNALAAYRVGELLGIPKKIILEGLALYQGAWRRFEYRGEFDGAKIFDDYAHNPAKVKAALAGARERFPKKQIWCVFQPHQIERTKILFNDFVKSFDNAHHVILLDIYQVAGREKQNRKKEVNAFQLASAIAKRNQNDVYYLPYHSQLRDFFKDSVGEHDIIMMVGAGDIWKLTDQLIY